MEQGSPEITLSFEEVGDSFKIELRRTEIVTSQITMQVIQFLHVLKQPLSRRDIQQKLGL